MGEYDGLSPYIAESLRQHKRTKAQQRALSQALEEQGIPESIAKEIQLARRILGGPSAYEKSRKAKAQLQQRERNKRRVEGPVGRAMLYERDGGKCYLCEQDVTLEAMHLDHVLPLSRGGSHTADNLRVACGRCNTSKGSLTLSEYLATLDRVP